MVVFHFPVGSLSSGPLSIYGEGQGEVERVKGEAGEGVRG